MRQGARALVAVTLAAVQMSGMEAQQTSITVTSRTDQLAYCQELCVAGASFRHFIYNSALGNLQFCSGYRDSGLLRSSMVLSGQTLSTQSNRSVDT